MPKGDCRSRKKTHFSRIPAVKEKLNVLKEMVEYYTEKLDSSADSDTRLGHKTADYSFFGFKNEELASMIGKMDEELLE